MNKTKIEIQYFRSCPNSKIFIERIKDAIKGMDSIVYLETLVETNEKAAEVSFRGSPTLLINGQDFENTPAPKNPALTCRFYPGGLPSVETIRKKIIT